MEDSKELTLILQLIPQLLAANSPQLGSQLKQKLNRALLNQGVSPFNEKLYGHKRFADFLSERFDGHVIVERPQGAGDISVLLNPQFSANTPALTNNIKQIDHPVIRSEVWQAFANPDKARKRFLHKSDLTIVHFNSDVESAEKMLVEKSPDDFIEIEPISGEMQLGWMRAFVETIKLPPTERSPIISLLDETYTGGLNATFTRALGGFGNDWRSFRTHNVMAEISKWAEGYKLTLNDLSVNHHKKPDETIEYQDIKLLSHRQQALQLLQMLTDDEIAKMVIPTLLSTFLQKNRS
jgi:hypothetical protein